jgi:hypothetical protein
LKQFRVYLFLVLIIALTMAIAPGCSKPAPASTAPAAPVVPGSPAVPVAPPAAPPKAVSPDLVITKIWLDGPMVYYTIKNTGAADAPQTNSGIYVNDRMPDMGGYSLVDTLKAGQDRTTNFSNYEWPYTPAKVMTPTVNVNPAGYVDLPLQNYKVKVCADAKNEAVEANETDNCKVALIGIRWEHNLLTDPNLATWKNNDGVVPEPGSENSAQGAHFTIPNADMEQIPQLEIIPQQVPQGWMQGTWGYFYKDEYGSPKTAAIKVPAKLHFIAKIGLARNAEGSDGVTYKFGVKDLNDTITWLDSKKATVPGTLQDWDINLTDLEGQNCYFLLRVDAGESPAKDYAIWNQAKLIQVDD